MKTEFIRTTEITKDLPAQQEIEERLVHGKRVYKNYQRAKANGTDSQKGINPVIEQMYHIIVKKVKMLYTSLPNKEDRVVIMLNNEQDPTDSHGLFTILTPHFFFYLECDIVNQYRIEYLFHNCPVETEIQQLIIEFSMKSYSTEKMNVPHYPTYFNNVLSCQPDRFIHRL